MKQKKNGMIKKLEKKTITPMFPCVMLIEYEEGILIKTVLLYKTWTYEPNEMYRQPSSRRVSVISSFVVLQKKWVKVRIEKEKQKKIMLQGT